jgi:hypothetical protein
MLFQVKEVGCPKLISRKTLKTNWNEKVKLMSELIILIIIKKPKSSV